MEEEFLVAVWCTAESYEDYRFNIGLFRSVDDIRKWAEQNFLITGERSHKAWGEFPTIYVQEKEAILNQEEGQYYITCVDTEENGFEVAYTEIDHGGWIHIERIKVLS